MKIAYFSPFSPDPSGISDFSEELLPELGKYMDIDLFSRIKIENTNIRNQFPNYRIEEFKNNNLKDNYDFLVYQVGNNHLYHKEVIDTFLEYPDILELHDVSLHHFLAEDTYVQHDYEKYVEIMKYCHGKDGERTARRFLNGEIRAPWENHAEKYIVNKYLIDKARAVIVHSDFAKQTVKGIRKDVPIINIPLHTPDIVKDYLTLKENCKAKLKIPYDTLVFGSFGYATIAKRIEPILNALSLFKKEYKHKFKYYIVGKVEHIDTTSIIKKLDLEDNVIVTGFVEMSDFKTYMGACDICFNLRYPTQGESSASLHRMLGMGKPILVTNIGSFEEYPEEIVAKVRHDEHEVSDILSIIKRMTNSDQELKTRSKLAYEFANNNCDIKKNAKRYFSFLSKIENGSYQEEYIDYLLDNIMELNLCDEKYVVGLGQKVFWL